MRKVFFNTLLLVLFGGVLLSTSASGSDLQKTYTWKYSISKDGTVTADNYDCNLTIHIWDKAETEYRLTIDASPVSEEDKELLDKFLQNMKFSNSPNAVRFRSNFWKNRNTMMGRTKMELEGSRDVVLSDFSIKAELWIPSGCTFELISKYSVINMEEFSGPLTLNLYNDNLYTGNIKGKTELEAKYSTIEFKDLKDVNANLYNTKLDLQNCGNMKIESKYSKITAVTSGVLVIDSYNDKYTISRTGDISFTSKYSDLKTESSGILKLDCYEGTLILKDVKDIELASKYADFQIGSAGNISVSSAYNNKLTIGKLSSLKIEESKYCSYKIDELVYSVTENDGYEDKFNITRTGSSFREINISGKYVDVSLALPQTTDFRFRAKIQYPKLEMDESKFKTKTRISEGSNLEYDAVKGTDRDGMPLIEVNGYQIALKISGI
jgi:hypothetical protein